MKLIQIILWIQLLVLSHTSFSRPIRNTPIVLRNQPQRINNNNLAKLRRGDRPLSPTSSAPRVAKKNKRQSTKYSDGLDGFDRARIAPPELNDDDDDDDNKDSTHMKKNTTMMNKIAIINLNVGPCATTKYSLGCNDASIDRSLIQKVLLTGLGHASTHWSARMLGAAGVDMPHESYSSDGTGSVSWEFIARGVQTPHGLVRHRFVRVVHILRFPLNHVSSLMIWMNQPYFIRSMLSFRENNPEMFKQFSERLFNTLTENTMPLALFEHERATNSKNLLLKILEKSLIHYVSWNAIVMSAADDHIHMENMTLADLCDKLKVGCVFQETSSEIVKQYEHEIEFLKQQMKVKTDSVARKSLALRNQKVNQLLYTSSHHKYPPKNATINSFDCIAKMKGKIRCVQSDSHLSHLDKNYTNSFAPGQIVLKNAKWKHLYMANPGLAKLVSGLAGKWGYCSTDESYQASSSVFC
jgi:hypothetical protein